MDARSHELFGHRAVKSIGDRDVCRLDLVFSHYFREPVARACGDTVLPADGLQFVPVIRQDGPQLGVLTCVLEGRQHGRLGDRPQPDDGVPDPPVIASMHSALLRH